MKDLIICDTREKNNKSILKYFDQINQDYIISKLDVGDYMLYKDYSTIIDKKDGLLELSHNLCNSLEHERIKREIQRSKDLGCTNFIFLVQDSKIKTLQDIEKWSSPHTQVKGSTLLKIIQTMKKKYNIRFIFVSKKDMPKKIIQLLKNE